MPWGVSGFGLGFGFGFTPNEGVGDGEQGGNKLGSRCTHNHLLLGLEPDERREGSESLLPIEQLRQNQHTVDRPDTGATGHSHIPSTRRRGR